MRMEQRLVPAQRLNMQQRQILAPRMLQATEILALPTTDLEALVKDRLQENVALEAVDTPEGEYGPGGDGSDAAESSGASDPGLAIGGAGGAASDPLAWISTPDDAPFSGTAAEVPKETAEGAADQKNELGVETLDSYVDGYERSDDSPGAGASSDEGDLKQAALENTPGRESSLTDYLLEQLATVEASAAVMAAARRIIAELDRNGWLAVPLEQIVPYFPGEESEDVALDAIDLVQSLDPPGIGARNLKECLLLQLSPKDIDYPLYKLLIDAHWEGLVKGEFERVARATHHTADDIRFAFDQLRSLDPWPGRRYSRDDTQIVRPDVIVEEDPSNQGEYRVRLVEESIPRIRIHSRYQAMLAVLEDPRARAECEERGRAGNTRAAALLAEAGSLTPERVLEIRKRVDEARELIEAIAMRSSTLANVARLIFVHQREFLEVGVQGLRPLQMTDLADELSKVRVGEKLAARRRYRGSVSDDDVREITETTRVHASTVSRAVADKHVETPRGIFPLRMFFVSGMASGEGESAARPAIIEQIRSIVAAEDSQKPLGDDQIAVALEKQMGVKVARRTVVKYREELGILNSRERRAR
jgi:RNA polymerase sigma-54 factor